MAQATAKNDVGGTARGPLVRTMPWGQAVRWQLPVLMANAQIRFAKQVQELLTAQGVKIGHSRVHELVTQAPARLTVEVQFALCRIFDCTPSDLWLDLGQVATDHEPDPAARQRLRGAKVVRAGEFL
ncbi:helix-turn-helix domain-containing protein [Streptosporangium sp. CA-115845]|uniref:helix-turn-helix domain-containing protein n=1 Tax=Streptosporangium sp. CA-115845 TaxID=3240071 RepID=UPI003D8F6DEC